MALPNFVPIIGTGPNALSDIGQQQANWFRTNAGIESDNLSRAHQAQAEQNSWLAQLAQWQRQDQERASQDQDKELNRQTAAQTAAEQRREFDVNTGVAEKKIAAEQDERKWHLDIRDADIKKDQGVRDNAAKFFAKNAPDYARNFDDASKELRDATAALDTSASKANATGNLVFKNKQFIPASPLATDAAKQEAADANAKIAADRARYDDALQNYHLHLSTWGDLQKRAAIYQLEINKDGTVYNPQVDKTYGSPTKKAVPPTATATQAMPMPSWLKPYDTSNMGLPPSIPSNDASGGDITPPSASFSTPDSPVQRVVRGPDGKLTMTSAMDNIPPVFVQGAF